MAFPSIDSGINIVVPEDRFITLKCAETIFRISRDGNQLLLVKNNGEDIKWTTEIGDISSVV